VSISISIEERLL